MSCFCVQLLRELQHENIVRLDNVYLNMVDSSLYLAFDYADHDLYVRYLVFANIATVFSIMATVFSIMGTIFSIMATVFSIMVTVFSIMATVLCMHIFCTALRILRYGCRIVYAFKRPYALFCTLCCMNNCIG